MHSSAVYLLSLALLLLLSHSAFGIAADPLHAVCSNAKNYSADDDDDDDDAFSSNLNQIMFLLSTKAPPIGFALGSIGQGHGRVHGLALCRGDVTSSLCATCIRAANARLLDLCPSNKEAIIWFDECMVRYSDVEFFGDVDYGRGFYMSNPQNVSDPLLFDRKVTNLMNGLKKKAYLSPLLFATGGDESQGLYGLVHCTKDLSGGDCKKCLETAIDELACCCGGKRGGRVVGSSCNVRYELHRFFDS